jgi:cystathionine beta-lyase/cystathionine gamma-synthase
LVLKNDGRNYEFSNDTFFVFSDLAAETFSIKVKDTAGCTSAAESVTIKQANSTLKATADSIADATCAASNGSATITATGGTAPYTYSLDGGPFRAAGKFDTLAAGNHKVTVRDNAGCNVEVSFEIKQANSTLKATADSIADATCAASNGSATVTATGGTPPYTYSLDGGIFLAGSKFDKLAAGNHKVTVRDNAGCNVEVSFEIKQANSTLKATADSIADATCAASTGSATVTATGGTPPYTYSLDGGIFLAGSKFDNLAAGNHKVTVRDNAGCNVEVSFEIKQANSTLKATADSIADATCAASNGSATITATGGTAPYTYSLDGGIFLAGSKFDKLAAGNHKVTVRDNAGCNVEVSFEIKQANSTLKATADSIADATCAASNGSATITATGGTAPYTYSLDGGIFLAGSKFDKLAAGNHKVTVRDNAGCNVEVSFEIKQANSTLKATADSIADATCAASNGSATITATGGTAPYTYSLDGGPFRAAGKFDTLAAGNHKVTVRDNAGCNVEVSFEIKQANSTLKATADSIADATCAASNGSATITATGGTAPYTYSLDGGIFLAGSKFDKLAAGNHKVTVRDNAGCNVEVSFEIKQANSTLKATADSIADATCAASTGSATVTATGGTPPYTYSLDGGIFLAGSKFDNLAAGNHKVTVRDNAGCNVEVSFEIKQANSTLKATADSIADATCAASNGSATITATGGTPPYTYSLDGGPFRAAGKFDTLAAGNHKVTVRDNAGCNVEVSFEIKQANSTLKATADSIADATCAASTGSATVTATGGTPPYTYSLDGGIFLAGSKFDNLAAGNHKVTVRDNAGCNVEVSFEIKQANSTLKATADSIADATCAASTGSATVTATGGTPPYTYSLDGGIFLAGSKFDNLAAGNHKVTVRDNAGCNVEVSFEIKQANSTLKATADSIADATCAASTGSATVTATGGTPPYTYSLDGGIFLAGSKFDKLAAGNHKVTVRDNAGCNVEVSFEIKQANSTLKATADSIADATCAASNGSATVTATGGTPPYTYSLDGGPFGAAGKFDTLAAGSYKITVKDNAGCTFEVSFVIRQGNSTLTATADTVPATCAASNGSATITATGGTPPYTYSLDGGPFRAAGKFDTLAAGSYKVTVKDKAGCNFEVSITIRQAGTKPNLVISNPPPHCAGTPVDLTSDSITNGSDPALLLPTDGC